MKSVVVKIFLMLCALPLSLWAQSDSSSVDPRLVEPEVPKITFEQTTLDFGKLSISKAQRRTLTIPFTNTGKAALVIESAETNCGCTTVTFPSKAIKPGKRGKIRITVDAAHQEDLGRYGNIITLYYNAPQHFTRLHAFIEFVE